MVWVWYGGCSATHRKASGDPCPEWGSSRLILQPAPQPNGLGRGAGHEALQGSRVTQDLQAPTEQAQGTLLGYVKKPMNTPEKAAFGFER